MPRHGGWSRALRRPPSLLPFLGRCVCVICVLEASERNVSITHKQSKQSLTRCRWPVRQHRAETPDPKGETQVRPCAQRRRSCKGVRETGGREDGSTYLGTLLCSVPQDTAGLEPSIYRRIGDTTSDRARIHRYGQETRRWTEALCRFG